MYRLPEYSPFRVFEGFRWLRESKSQKELIKDRNRNYENLQHWNLDTEYLEPLKVFLVNNIKQTE